MLLLSTTVILLHIPQALSLLSTDIQLAISVFNIINDIWILCLPIRELNSLQRPRREKIALGMIFGVGAIAVVASMLRLYAIHRFTTSTDQFRDGLVINLWSIIEITVATSCASVSAIRPVFHFSKYRRQRTMASDPTASYRSENPLPEYSKRNKDDSEEAAIASWARAETDVGSKKGFSADSFFHSA
jgi:hypothetical protein